MVRIVVLVAVMVAGCAARDRVAPVAVSTSRVTDLEGRVVDPFSGAAGRRATVLLFITTDCPIANAYAPEIQRLREAFERRGVSFNLVYAAPDLSAGEARRHYGDYGYKCGAVLDPGQELVRRAGATVTPEAAVFLASGELVYRGRINNLYADFGKPRFAATVHDLRDVLQQIVEGKSPALRTTQAIGCYISM